MDKKKNTPSGRSEAPIRQDLREAAEKLANAEHFHFETLSDNDARLLLHELSVHQIELKMQNDELQRTQQELQTSYKNFYQLYHHAPVGYLRVDPKGYIAQCNQQFLDWTGRRADRVEGRYVSEFISLNHRLPFRYWLESTANKRKNATFELQRSNGTTLYVDATLRELNWQNQTNSYLLVFTDITALKQAEIQLELAATVFETASEGCLVTDANQRIILVNKAFCRMTGYEEQEIIGQSPALLNSGRQDDAFFRTFWLNLREHGKWEGEVWNRHKNGDIFPHRLSVTVMYDGQRTPYRYVGLYSDISQKKQQEELIFRQATQDALTGLANRAYYNEQLQTSISQAQRHGHRLALMLLDLDGFKEINDTLGHDAGDAVLREVARRLLACVRKVDLVARIGGDEFVLLLNMNEDAHHYLDELSGKIINEIALPYQLGEHQVVFSASLGVAFYPDHASDAESLQKNADQAMYAAKQQGKNRVCYFMPEMQQAVLKRRKMVQDLQQAVKIGQFCVYYQPIVQLNSSKVVKAEALIRWQHPERGMIDPDQFISLAEETGLINPIGDWVLTQASLDIQRWQQQHMNLQLSVNVSAIQLREISESFMATMQRLNEQQLAHNIVLELTERVLVEHTLDKALLYMHQAQMEIALDDFGTGYSSLAYLQEFDIDYLKIDQSFVNRLTPNSSSHALCEAVVVMAHKLGMKVIAEGIETREQRDLLCAMGCDYGQGYFFGRPMPVQQFEQILAAGEITTG